MPFWAAPGERGHALLGSSWGPTLDVDSPGLPHSCWGLSNFRLLLTAARTRVSQRSVATAKPHQGVVGGSVVQGKLLAQEPGEVLRHLWAQHLCVEWPVDQMDDQLGLTEMHVPGLPLVSGGSRCGLAQRLHPIGSRGLWGAALAESHRTGCSSGGPGSAPCPLNHSPSHLGEEP